MPQVQRNAKGQWSERKEAAKQRLKRSVVVDEELALTGATLLQSETEGIPAPTTPELRKVLQEIKRLKVARGGQRRLVVLAYVEVMLVAWQRQHPYVIMSHDEMAVLAGVGKNTAQRGQALAAELGFIRRESRMTATDGVVDLARYRRARADQAHIEQAYVLYAGPELLRRMGIKTGARKAEKRELDDYVRKQRAKDAARAPELQAAAADDAALDAAITAAESKLDPIPKLVIQGSLNARSLSGASVISRGRLSPPSVSPVDPGAHNAAPVAATALTGSAPSSPPSSPSKPRQPAAPAPRGESRSGRSSAVAHHVAPLASGSSATLPVNAGEGDRDPIIGARLKNEAPEAAEALRQLLDRLDRGGER